MATLEKAAGGVAGGGGTVALRQFLDKPTNTWWKQPSVMYGLGTGLLGAGVWWAGNNRMINVPMSASDFFGGHAATALPAGLISAFLHTRN